MLFMQVVCAFVLFALGMGILQAQTSPRAMGLDDLVRIALERNRDLLALRQRLEEARGLMRQAGVRPAPTIEVTGSTGRMLGTLGEEEFTAGFFQPIETFGKRGKRIQVAEKSASLAESEIADRIRQLSFELKALFADAIAEQQKLQAFERLHAVNSEYARLVQERVRLGDAAPLELQLLLADVSRTQAQIELLTGRYESSILELKRISGLKTSEPMVLDSGTGSSAPSPSLDDLRSRALEERPDLRIARLLEVQSTAELALAQAEAHPNLTVSASYLLRRSRFDQQLGVPALRDRDNILSFGVSVPLFSANQNAGNIEAALSRSSAARLRREYMEAAIPMEVEAAYRRWSAARRAVEVFRPGVLARAESNLQVVQQAYSMGQLRMLDVLYEQRRLIETQMAHIDGQSESAKSLAALERAVGGSIQ